MEVKGKLKELKLILSFYIVGLSNWTQVVKVVNNFPYLQSISWSSDAIFLNKQWSYVLIGENYTCKSVKLKLSTGQAYRSKNNKKKFLTKSYYENIAHRRAMKTSQGDGEEMDRAEEE